MKKSIKYALVLSGIYLAISLVGFSLTKIDSPIILLFTIPTIILNIFGILLMPGLLPKELCHPSGFMGCESNTGMIFTIILNVVFYFLIGLLVGRVYSGQKISRNILTYSLVAVFVILFILLLKVLFIK